MTRAVLIAALFLLGSGAVSAGPLRVLESNPRWFTDGSGKAVYLAGSHVWQNLQDNGLIIRGSAGTSNPPPVFDYEGYLDKLAAWNHNFFRLWRWETTKWTDTFTGGAKYCRPHPWVRSGPGVANDGEPKFDLTRVNEDYFKRLRERVVAAQRRGMYVSVMLFEGWELQFTDAWEHHPFHAPNNVNGIEADLNGDMKALEYTTLDRSEMGRRVLELQRAYVRKVIDTVNDLDNVLYEICNESHPGSTQWQYDMIRFVKEYEKTKPAQHPVGMTFQYRGGSNQALYDSPADWISPNPGDDRESYREHPCADCTTKVVVNDTDHLWGHTGGDSIWVWKSFTRGLNVLLMEEMLPSPTWQDSARQAMGQVRRFAERMNLAAMKPEPKLATGYCLAERGREYLVFQHDKGEFALDLKDAPGTFAVEWFDINAGRSLAGAPVEGGANRTFTTPFPGPAALYLKRTGDAAAEVRAATIVAFTEGPAVYRDGSVFFTEAVGHRIMRLWPDGRLTVFREKSNAANGLLFDDKWRLVACEGSDLELNRPRVTRTDMETGKIEVLAEFYQGKRLNAPNDVTIDGRGRLYFTDFDLAGPERWGTPGVYRIDPEGRLTRLLTAPEIQRPNGIAISPDDRTLYLVESNPAEGGARMIRAYDLLPDGSLARGRVFHNFYLGRSADGLAIDTAGNLYAAAGLHRRRGTHETLDTKPGVHVFSPAGDLLRYIPIPEDTISNCAFGGPDMKTLYVTAGKTLYTVRVETAGTRR